MKALVCLISWRAFYRSEEALAPCVYNLEDYDANNFINLNGHFYGYFLNNDQKEGTVDYVIFVAKHPNLGNRIVGWYKNAVLSATPQYYEKDCPYYVTCKDEDAVLLNQKDRDYPLEINGPYEWIDIDRRLKFYLEKTNQRINYRQSDLNKSLNISLNNIKDTCETIERALMNQDYLLALQITNRAIMIFGKLASLYYYKATVLYFFLQYRQASIHLAHIYNVEAYHDVVCFMLGNIYFETGQYEQSIQVLRQVKNHERDKTQYLLSQAYAMKNEVALAKGAIELAILYNPNESVYQAFKQSLKEWEHES